MENVKVRGLKRLIGTKSFYKRILLISLPIMLQQGITTLVGLLDNVMVGNFDDLAMSGVGVSNQIFFVINVVILGGFAAPGIFVAQFFGAKDEKGVQIAIRYKIWLGIIVFVISSTLLLLFGGFFVNQFLKSGETTGDPEIIYNYAMVYLYWMIGGYIPFIITQVYASSLRETGETRLQMWAGIIAILVNLVLNFILIYGYLGLPRLGVVGAAIATIISRIVEMTIIVIVVHRHQIRFSFAYGLWKTLRIPIVLTKKITFKGLPLIINEFLWSLGMTTVAALYYTKGTNVITALTISNTTTNLFFILFNAMAVSITIIIGQALGAGQLEEARDSCWKLLAFMVFICFVASLMLAGISYFIPMIYTDVTKDVRILSTIFMLIVAGCYPIFAFNAGCFFTLRAGGVTFITFLFDCMFVWVIYIPIAYCLIHFTNLSIILIYFIVQVSEILKSFLGYAFVKSGIWIKNIVSKPDIQEVTNAA